MYSLKSHITPCPGLILPVLFLFLSFNLIAQKHFTLTEDIKEAYFYATSLRMQEAREKIDYIKQNDPANLLVYHVENYIDFFRIFINEDYEEYLALQKNKDQRLEMIDGGDKTSPYYLFSKAEILLQWATVRIKFGEKLTPAREVYRAYKLLEENLERFPDFIENKKSLSIIHALSESIPGIVKTILGMKGSIRLGTDEIEEVIAYSDTHDFIFRNESYAIYAYILFYQNNKKDKAYEVLKNAELDHTTNPLLCFIKANIYQKTGHGEEAIQILKSCPKGENYLPFYYLDFMYGKFLLYDLDPSANIYIEHFIENFNGRHFIKEAYQKLAWYELAIKDNILGYKKYMQMVNTEGYDLIDEDKQALKESNEKNIPNPVLLKARLLFDGGHYVKAYNLLVKKSYLFINGGKGQLEYYYRMGRLTHQLKNYHDAIEYYNAAYKMGRHQNSYMACNSALQMGLIYEEQKKYKKAIKYFNLCLDMNPYEYKTSLHQKAQSGLNRIEKY